MTPTVISPGRTIGSITRRISWRCCTVDDAASSISDGMFRRNVRIRKVANGMLIHQDHTDDDDVVEQVQRGDRGYSGKTNSGSGSSSPWSGTP